MPFKNESIKNIINSFFLFIYLIFISSVISYDSSLLKINYFYDDKNLCYINAFSNSNGD